MPSSSLNHSLTVGFLCTQSSCSQCTSGCICLQLKILNLFLFFSLTLLFLFFCFFVFLFPEELLNNFAQQIGAWRFCLYFLSSTRNDYVMMYSLTVFEVRCCCWGIGRCLPYFAGSYRMLLLLSPRLLMAGEQQSRNLAAQTEEGFSWHLHLWFQRLLELSAPCF